MWNVTVKGLLARKLRLALTALSIVLGVAFVSGTLVLTDTLHNTLSTLYGNIYQHINFEVQAPGVLNIPESILSKVRRVPGAADPAGPVSVNAHYGAPTASPNKPATPPAPALPFPPTRRPPPSPLVEG